MKKTFFALFIALFSCLNMFSQATSLTVDCQNPGWLSNMIPFNDQLTLENLTVTGYLNGTDFKFLRELSKNRSLHGVLNLENANIVAGGDAYFTNSNNKSYYTKDNYIGELLFIDFNVRKLITPHSVTEIAYYIYTQETGSPNGSLANPFYAKIDSLILNGSMKYFSLYHTSAIDAPSIKYIELTDSIEVIEFGKMAYFNKLFEMHLPSCLKKMGASISYLGSESQTEQPVLYSKIQDPSKVEVYLHKGKNGYINPIRYASLYVPEGTVEAYKNSVFKQLNIIENIPVRGISFNKKSVSMYVDNTLRLSATITPANAIHKEKTFASSDTTIVSISEDGIMHAKTFGETWVYAYTYKKEFADSCLVSVYNHTEGLTLDDNLSVKIGDAKQLDWQTLPLGTTDNKVRFSSSDDKIANVNSDGVVRGLSKGSCVITATSVDGGYMAECTVTVLQPIETLVMEKHALTVNVGATECIYCRLEPTYADNKKLMWSTNDERIASVDVDGTITGKKAGETYIIATSEDNPAAKDSCKVTVLQPVTNIALDHNTYELHGIGASGKLTATVEPEDASNKDVTWKSSNESVCVVSNGTIIAVGYGESVIIATSVDGGHMAICSVKVDDNTPVKGIDAETSGYKVYNLQGIEKTQLQKGINIIRFKDGTSKKVLVK